MKSELFDITGHKVIDLFDNEYPPGTYNIGIDLSAFPPGLYLVKLTSENDMAVRKLVVR